MADEDTPTEVLDLETIRALPKVALHDHLDGGVRPQTMLDIAAEVGHQLPAGDADSLATWFFEAADSGSLVRYLETFDHTIAVMQRAEDLRRIAREFVLDQAADSVVYAEARWAPEQHTRAGLSMAEAIRAVGEGLREGVRTAADQEQYITVRQLVTGMRHTDTSREVAELGLDHAGDLVAGFDIAGPEDGFPPSNHAAAFSLLRENLGRFTIHAGEAAGVDSIRDALVQGGQRLGHGVRLIEDIDDSGDLPSLGPVAAYVLDRQIPLEVCPTSNLQTGIAQTYAEHPVGTLVELGFNVTISCDNRLMSRTTLSNELHQLVQAFGFDRVQLARFARNSIRAAFLPHTVAEQIFAEQIVPGYAG
ncbi:adenosine deaminase [Naumannella sp. ID2617S]|nr:adenosine deaminase [Naumannella sp. ID2617S]